MLIFSVGQTDAFSLFAILLTLTEVNREVYTGMSKQREIRFWCADMLSIYKQLCR